MPTTARGYPFPDQAAPPDVPTDLEALADAIDTDVAAVNAARIAAIAALVIPKVASGTYTGNGGTDRTIVLGFQPSFVYVIAEVALDAFISAIGTAGTVGLRNAHSSISGADVGNTAENTNALRPRPAATGFIVSGTSAGDTNTNAVVYRYIAIGV